MMVVMTIKKIEMMTTEKVNKNIRLNDSDFGNRGWSKQLMSLN